jgi:hypothetical protein
MEFKKDDIVKFISEFGDGLKEFNCILIEDPDEDRVKVITR